MRGLKCMQRQRNCALGRVNAATSWRLEDSVLFGRRKAECEARDFGDSADDFARQFETDWARVAAKSRFVRLLSFTDPAVLGGDKEQLLRGASSCIILYSWLDVCSLHSTFFRVAWYLEAMQFARGRVGCIE